MGSKPTLMDRSGTLFSALLDFVFPPRCVACRIIGRRICGECSAGISWIDTDFCPRCGQPHAVPRSHACLDSSRLSFIRSAAVFSGAMRKALHSLKYRFDAPLAGDLAALAYPHWTLPSWKYDLLIPIPLGRRRERERGYNQSLLLAEALSRITGIPATAGKAARVRETRSQVGLAIGDRKANMADAFAASGVAGKKILLLDDVCTTGATILSCAEALIQAGAEAVGALTLARAVLPASSPFIPIGGLP